MRPYKKVISFSVVLGIFLLAGCAEMGQSFGTASGPVDAGQKDSVAAKRFQDTNPDGRTAVESAIELSKKYATLSDEVGQLKLEKQTFTNENAQLKERAELLQLELNQAKKELTEANDLLIEMRIELNNWKADVIGFRDEMRQADKAQLETLIKILKVLGGETKTEVFLENKTQDKAK